MVLGIRMVRLADALHARIYLIFLMLLSCAAVSVADDSECVPSGQALLPKYKKVVSLAELPQIYSKSQVVLLGEHHDNAEHHRWQLQMITALHIQRKDIALGLEMFPRRAQPVLDKWVAGELSEEEFIRESGWQEYWRFEPSLYMPIFNYARMNKIPMYAVNVERSLIQKVGKQGWDNIPLAEREGVTKPESASQGYRELLANAFMSHGSDHGDKREEEKLKEIMAQPSFENFVASQQVWDRAMAEGIVTALGDSKGRLVVSLSGSGHIMYSFGIPEQLASLGISDISTLVPWAPEFTCDYVKSGLADAVIGLQTQLSSHEDISEQEKRPLLGVFLDKEESRVKIKRVIQDSVAESAGIKAGDYIIQIASRPVSGIDDVISTVKSLPFGIWLPLVIEREGVQREFVAKFPPLDTP